MQLAVITMLHVVVIVVVVVVHLAQRYDRVCLPYDAFDVLSALFSPNHAACNLLDEHQLWEC